MRKLLQQEVFLPTLITYIFAWGTAIFSEMSTKTLQHSADITPWPPVYIANDRGLSGIQGTTDIFSI